MIEDLPPGQHNLLVRLSGGADSSIIYYGLCDKFKHRNDVNIICLTTDTHLQYNNSKTAKKIIDIVSELTGKQPITHYVNKVTENCDEDFVNGQEALQKRAYNEYNITRRYSGLTINPPIKELELFVEKYYKKFGFNLDYVKARLAGRDKTRDNNLKYVHNERAHIIFRNGDKRMVKALYDKYNMLEKLFPYTFSCTHRPYITRNGQPVHCGQCFSCVERLYAFGRMI